MNHDNLIGGAWVAGKSYAENRNPADLSDVVGLYAQGTAADAEAAIEAAAAAFPGWRDTTPWTRAEILDKVANAIFARKDELGRLLAREEGKTLAEATAEVVRAGQIFKFFSGEALRLTGEVVDSVRPGVEVEMRREPMGVVALITPWNFPIAIPAWKIAPALAYGNTVVIKPAGIAPGCAWALAEILKEAGIPDGVFNLVMGSGGTVGEALIRSDRIAALSFTGSVATGKRIGAACFENGVKFQLEMGGKNPLIVADDADLDVAVSCAVNGAFFSTGQRCTASSRIIVMERVHDAFVEKFVAAAKALKVGNPLDSATQIGPVVDQGQLESNLNYVRLAAEEGCEVLGGERLNMETEGYYQAPAVFLKATNAMRSSREEIFGPCASVIKAGDWDEAVEIANDTPFGLSSGAVTTSLKRANDFRRRSAAGMVMINLPTAGVDFHVPFGGRKGSSYGPREQGAYAREFYTSVKTSYIA